MRRTVTLLGVFLCIAIFSLNGYAQPRTLGARGLILDDGANRRIQITDLNRAIGIGTNNPDPSSILHLDGLGSFGVFPPYGTGVNAADGVGPRGVLLPRMTTAQRNDIDNPANGLLIYNTDVGQFQYYNGGTFSWTPMATSGWSVLGNTIPAAGTGPGGNFIGTLNAQDFVIATNVGVAGSGAGERIRVTSAGAVNILTANVGTTAIGMTGANSSSTAINVGNTGNLLLNGIGPVGAPFEFLTKHTGSNEVKVLGGGGSIAEQGVTFNNEGGNFRFRLGGLLNTDNPLLANRFVNLAGNSLFFTNSGGLNLVQFNGATNAVNINTATAGNTSIGAAGSTNTINGTTNTINGTNNTIAASATNLITGPTNNVTGTNNTLTAGANNTLTAAGDNVLSATDNSITATTGDNLLTAADDNILSATDNGITATTGNNTITATAGSNLISAPAASNILTSDAGSITVTGGDLTVNVPGGGSLDDLILNGIDITNTNYDLLLINIGTNEVRRRATADLAEQGLIWQTEADGDSKVRLGVRNGDALGLNALEEDRNVYLGGFNLNFSQNDGADLLVLNDVTNNVSIIPNISGTANIGSGIAGDITITTNTAIGPSDLVFENLDLPQNDFDLLVINNLAPDINSVTRAAGPAVTEQGITFNNEGGETRIRHGSLTAGILPSDAPFEANRFENLNGFTYNITNSNAQGNDVFASFNGGTNAINFNTIDLGVVTIGNTTANRHLNVNGVANAVVGSPFATTALWDQLITGDLGVTGLVKIGNSVWIDANLPTAEFRSENPLDFETNGPDNITFTSNGDFRAEINGATGNVGIGLGASPVSPLQVSANTGLMPAAPNQDGVHLGQDVINNHGISIVDNGATQVYLDFTNDFVNDYDARLSYVTAGSILRFESPGNVTDHQHMLNGNNELTIDGATGNTAIGTNAAPTVNHQLYVQGTSNAPVVANTTGIQTLGTAASNLLTLGQVDASRAWIQSNAQPLTINELGTNVTIGTLAGGHGPAVNTLLGNDNIITSNNDITMTVGTDPGDELTLINIDAPTENIDVLVIHDQAEANPNWVRRAEENTSQLTEQGITFNNEAGQNRIRLGALTSGIDVNVDAPFEADRFVNLVENEILFTGGAASTFNVLQLEGSAGVVNVMELASQNQGNTMFRLNGPATTGINLDMATTLLTNSSTGILSALSGVPGVNLTGDMMTVTTNNATARGINATALNTGGVGFANSALLTTTNNGTGTARGLDVVTNGGAASTGVDGAIFTTTNAGAALTRGIVMSTSKSGGGGTVTTGIEMTSTTNGTGQITGIINGVTQSGTGPARGMNMTVNGAATAGGVEGAIINTTNSGTTNTQGLLMTTTYSGAASPAVFGAVINTNAGSTAAVTGIQAVTQQTGTGNSVHGANIVTSGTPAGGFVRGIRNDVASNGTGDVVGNLVTVTDNAGAGGVATGGSYTVNGGGFSANATGLSVGVNGGTASNLGMGVTVAGAASVGIDINHPAAIGMTIDGGGNSIDADGSTLLGDGAGNDQHIVLTGTGPTTITTLQADVTVNTDPASGTGFDLVLTGIDENPTSPFDILVIEDGSNAVRRANSDALNQLTEQGITFNTEGGQTRVRLGDLAAGIGVVNAPFEADRFVNLVNNELTFTGGAASTFNVLQIEGSSGVVNQMELSSQNAGNTIFKLNGPAAVGIDIDPVVSGMLIDATDLGIHVGTGANKPNMGILVEPDITGVSVDGNATTSNGVIVDMTAPPVTTANSNTYMGSITGAAGVDVNGAQLTVNTTSAVSHGLLVNSTNTGGAGSARGANISASNTGTGLTYGMTISTNHTGGGGAVVRGLDMGTSANGGTTLYGIIGGAIHSGTGNVYGISYLAQKNAFGVGGTVRAGGFRGDGSGVATDVFGLSVEALGGTNVNTGADITVSGPNNVGVDILHSNIGLRIAGGNTSITNDGANYFGDGAGVDQMITNAGTGSIELYSNNVATGIVLQTSAVAGNGIDINATGNGENVEIQAETDFNANAGDNFNITSGVGGDGTITTFNNLSMSALTGDVTITVPGGGSGDDLILNNIDGAPTSPFDILVIEDAGNEVRRANSNSTEIVEQGITFNSEATGTKIRLGARTGVDPLGSNALLQNRTVYLDGFELSFANNNPGNEILQVEGSGGAFGEGTVSIGIPGSLNIQRRLSVNGRVDATVGMTLGGNAESWDNLLGGDVGIPGLLSVGSSIWIDGNSATREIRSSNALDIRTTVGNIRLDADVADGNEEIEIDGAGDIIRFDPDGDGTLNAFVRNDGVGINTGVGTDILIQQDGLRRNGGATETYAFTNSGGDLDVSIVGGLNVTQESALGDGAGNDALTVLTGTGATSITTLAADVTINTDAGATANDLVITGLDAPQNDFDVLVINNGGADANSVTRAAGNAIVEQGITFNNEGGETRIRLGARTGVDAVGTNALELNRSVYLNENMLTFADNVAGHDIMVINGAGGGIPSEGNVTIGVGNVTGTSQQRLVVNGHVNALVGMTLATDPTVWDLVLRGDQVTTGLAKFGGSLWVDGVSPTHQITSLGNDLLVNTTSGADLTLSTSGASAPLNMSTTGANSAISVATNQTSSSIGLSTVGTSSPIQLSTSGQDGVISATTTGQDGHIRLQASHATSDIYLTAVETRIGPAPEVAPTSTLQVAGSVAAATATGGTANLSATQFFYLVNAANQTITLPNATLCAGRIYVIKNNGVATNTTVNSVAGTIDGGAAFVQVAANAAVQYISDGTNWWIISTN